MEHTLIIILEKWRSALNPRGIIFALLMDFSKAFDSINHDLLLAKLKAYGFSINTLDLICSYLKYQKQTISAKK